MAAMGEMDQLGHRMVVKYLPSPGNEQKYLQGKSELVKETKKGHTTF